jgi:hypothetical protein
LKTYSIPKSQLSKGNWRISICDKWNPAASTAGARLARQHIFSLNLISDHGLSISFLPLHLQSPKGKVFWGEKSKQLKIGK